jgi:aryl-alcohol dehydrogenase-like predicted oxidoreductase
MIWKRCPRSSAGAAVYPAKKGTVMDLRTLGSLGLVTSATGLGCMGMTGVYGEADEQEMITTVRRALELGVTLFDTADVYGPLSGERLLGRALEGHRDDVIVASKFGGAEIDDAGQMVGGPNGRPEYVRASVDRSLRTLVTDRIDLYYQHRVDSNVPVEETFGALGELVAVGKLRYLGISEANADTIRRAHAVAPLSAVQTEYSLFSRDVESNGVLAATRELGIGFVAYAPLGRGFLAGTVRSTDGLGQNDLRRILPRFSDQNLNGNLVLLERIERIAGGLGISAAQLALAWVLAQGRDIVAIPGTRKSSHLEENIAASASELDAETVKALEEAVPSQAVVGRRYAVMETAIQD